ncbi:hypothetical protein PG987_016121 [Apiospora arundinis]
MNTSTIPMSPQGTGVTTSSATPGGNTGSSNASAKSLSDGSTASSIHGQELDAAKKGTAPTPGVPQGPGAAPVETATTAAPDGQPQASRPRQPWNKGEPLPDLGWAYTPFYGKKRGTTHLGKQSESGEDIYLNWVTRLPQDATTKEVDENATRSLETLMTYVAQHLGFSYVWITHNPRKPTPSIVDGGASGTNAWSIGASFGTDEGLRVVYGNIFVNVNPDNSRVVVGVLPVTEQDDILGGRRTYDLYLADNTEGAADIPRPFASRETPKPDNKAKRSNDGGDEVGSKKKVVVAAGKEGKPKALKANPSGVTKKTKRGKKVKGNNAEDDDSVMEENNTIVLINSTNFKLESFRGKVIMENR